ncbi:MAG: ATP-binding cassette domain-containing protein, partial [Micrococcales bacterium]|nr:ATP-binding cassette domain-containing protein [Micrococcales bacterium]
MSLVAEPGAAHPCSTSTPGVQLLDVSRRADTHAAVHRVHLAVPAGTVTALAGPDRACVSTMMGLLSTLLAPHAGHVRIGGRDTVTDTAAARTGLGYVGPTPLNWGALTVAEALDVAARAHSPGHRADRSQRRRIADLMTALGFPVRGRTWCADLPAARARRLGLACALVHGPQVLLLHDPLRGIDAAEQDELAALCRHLASRGMTIVLGAASGSDGPGDGSESDDRHGGGAGGDDAGHDSDEARGLGLQVPVELNGLADRVVVLRDGRLVAGRDLGDSARARRWRVVSWEGSALLAGLDGLGVEHAVIETGTSQTEATERQAAPDVTQPHRAEPQPVRHDAPADGLSAGGVPSRAQTVVEVAIAQDSDAAALLAALVAAGVSVHGFLPP